MLQKANNKYFQHCGAAFKKHFYNCGTELNIISCVNKNVVVVNAFTDNTGIEKNHRHFRLHNGCGPPTACVTSYKVICNPIVFTASLTPPILLITFCVSVIVFYFLLLFCSWFFRWKLPVSVSTTSSNTITSLILPLVLTPLPHLFCFSFAAFLCSHSSFLFCLASSACLFSSYIWTCSSLFNRHDFVTTRGGFCFGWFISGMTKELYKLAGMIPVATSGLLCFGDVWSSSGTESCWLEEVAADCW